MINGYNKMRCVHTSFYTTLVKTGQDVVDKLVEQESMYYFNLHWPLILPENIFETCELLCVPIHLPLSDATSSTRYWACVCVDFVLRTITLYAPLKEQAFDTCVLATLKIEAFIKKLEMKVPFTICVWSHSFSQHPSTAKKSTDKKWTIANTVVCLLPQSSPSGSMVDCNTGSVVCAVAVSIMEDPEKNPIEMADMPYFCARIVTEIATFKLLPRVPNLFS